MKFQNIKTLKTKTPPFSVLSIHGGWDKQKVTNELRKPLKLIGVDHRMVSPGELGGGGGNWEKGSTVW